MNFAALVMAYKSTTPPANSVEEYRQQIRQLFDEAAPLLQAVDVWVCSCRRQLDKPQYAFDALLSIALDIGIDGIADSPLPGLLRTTTSKRSLANAILALPVRLGSLRPELETQLRHYGIVKKRRSRPLASLLRVSALRRHQLFHYWPHPRARRQHRLCTNGAAPHLPDAITCGQPDKPTPFFCLDNSRIFTFYNNILG